MPKTTESGKEKGAIKKKAASSTPMLLDPNEGEPIEIIRSEEKWSECELKDGTILKIRPIIMGVNYHGKQPDGSPIYGMKTSIIVDTINNNKKRK